MRSNELRGFKRRFSRFGITFAGLDDSMSQERFERSEVENIAWSCLQDDTALKTGPFKNPSRKQQLMMKVRSRLRVICATPVGKRAAPSASTRFLCCVCISHQLAWRW
jgi:hypothetical protein